MLAKLRSRLRPPTAYEGFAIVLAFLALGSGSYAAITVTGRNVKNSSLTGKDIKNNSVTGKDVKGIKSGDVTDRSLLARDFALGQLPAGEPGKDGAAGPPGPTSGAIAGSTPQSPADTPFAVILASTTIDAKGGGDVFAFGRPDRVGLACGGNPCTGQLGLYVDDKPVPGSSATYGPGNNVAVPNPPPDVFGLLRNVGPGSHTIRLAFRSATGVSASTSGDQEPAVGGILVGS